MATEGFSRISSTITVSANSPPVGSEDAAVNPLDNSSSLLSGGLVYAYGWAIDSQMRAPVGAVKVGFSQASNRSDQVCYDAAGNQLDDWGCNPSGIQQFAFDAEERMSSSEWNGTQYIYDAEGRRVAMQSGGQTIGYYLYDNEGHHVADLDGGGSFLRRQIYLGDRNLGTYDDQQHTTIFALSDWLGTQRARVDMTSTICQTTTSQPFGDAQQINGTCSPSSNFFTGLERDGESGLDHATFRQYSSTNGRWLSPDPYDGSMDLRYPQTLNRYAYVGNNPLGYSDPTGLDGEGGGINLGDINPGKLIFDILNWIFPPSFQGSLTPRPGQIWDEHGGFHASPYSSIAAMIGDVDGFSTPGCEFGACGDDFASGQQSGSQWSDWQYAKLFAQTTWAIDKLLFKHVGLCGVGAFGYAGYEDTQKHQFLGYLPEIDSEHGFGHNVLLEKGNYALAFGSRLKSLEGMYFFQLGPEGGALVAVSPSGPSAGLYAGLARLKMGAGAGFYLSSHWKPHCE